MTLEWKEKLKNKLINDFGKSKGRALVTKYLDAFPTSYSDDYPVKTAIDDILYMETLAVATPVKLNFYLAPEKEQPLHLRIYQWNRIIPLSDILPILENLHLRTFNEHPYRLKMDKKEFIWISDYSVSYQENKINITAVKDTFEEAFTKIYFGQCENDGFNKLVLSAGLTWQDIVILRAYAKYLKQVGFRFTQAYIEKALCNHPSIAIDLIELFKHLNDPKLFTKNKNKAEVIRKQIYTKLEAVTSLDEDRILRRMMELIDSTLRTNHFQLKNNQLPDYLALKLDSRKIPDLPLPVPLYEIFVYSPRFEAIHLRNTKVARGGIRWSDRPEDFRTEILGLMKAQTVKNAVIVPSGAKGGFVLKKLPQPATRELVQHEVIHCYRSFISGLLDLTDNIQGKKFIKPKHVVCHDEIDPYLVVAADKGTSTFSDIANEISAEHDFWLGDAFASGGSNGYDHKKIGITARGAWESIKRHFRELSVDVRKKNITVIGIGDMSGDVFGNGMLYTNHLKLVAAFDHRDIFLDPDPDPQKSYEERHRMFHLPISSWQDYNTKVISKGGGIFSRTLKSIPLSKEIRKVLRIEDAALPPNEVIKAILKAPVDLFFNGGIGTYVKANTETASDVGDRANDYCRINGEELRCKVVGEGGNLGFTQLGRVEYASKGGLINTDFIDNSAGVDCSDHEVNLKILLNVLRQNAKMNENKRDTLLHSLTDEIAVCVLEDNYEQALVMSFSAHHARKNIGLHIQFIHEFESLGILNRKVEFLPDERRLMERKAQGEGLTRPELAVLLAYTKIRIKHEILASDLPEDPFLRHVIIYAFPPTIQKKYQKIMYEHRLHRDIIATQLSNMIVNEMGITFVYRLQTETNASTSDIVKACMVASHIFETRKLQKLVQSLDYKISTTEQFDMMFNLRNLINLSTRWFLHNNRLAEGNLEKIITHFATRIKELEIIIPSLMGGVTKEYLGKIKEQFIKTGLDDQAAQKIATYRAIYTALNIIEVATLHKFDLIKTAKVYFAAGEKVNLLWFRDQIANDSREGHWNTVARLTLRDELDIAQRSLTVAILNADHRKENIHELIEAWMKMNKESLDRWDKLLTMLHSSTNIDYTMFFIAMRELLSFITTSKIATKKC